MGSVPTFSATGTGLQTDQSLWLRRCQLTLSDQAGTTLDLSNLRVKFRVVSRTKTTLKHAEITVYNLSPETAQKIFNAQPKQESATITYATPGDSSANPAPFAQESVSFLNQNPPEFTQVSLWAGYFGLDGHGPFQQIFSGQIAYLRMGKEDAITSFLTIIASDGDAAYNWATINVPLPAELTAPQQQLDAILNALQPYGITEGSIPPLPDTPLPRGKALYKMVREALTDIANTVNCDWHIANGQLNFVSQTQPLGSDVIILTPQTGLIGAPEQTIDGLNVRALLNPNLVTGRLIQVYTSQINQAAIGKGTQPDLSIPYLPALSSNGLYMIYALTHAGDTRGSGNDWMSEIIAVAASGENATAIRSATKINAIVEGT